MVKFVKPSWMAPTKSSRDRMLDALEPLWNDPGRADFVAGQVELLVKLSQGVDGGALRALKKTKGDLGTLIELMQGESNREFLRKHDALASARTRGLKLQREALDAEGGALGAQEVADLLGLSRQAVDLRRAGGKLLAFDLGLRRNLYPRWQFTERGVLPGLGEALAVLREDRTPPWSCLRFFLSNNLRLEDERPLDRLRRGDVAAVVNAARHFDQQGAA